MDDLAILPRRTTKPVDPIDRLLSRAVRARGIAVMLSKKDADLLEAYAMECEADAQRLMEQQGMRSAA